MIIFFKRWNRPLMCVVNQLIYLSDLWDTANGTRAFKIQTVVFKHKLLLIDLKSIWLLFRVLALGCSELGLIFSVHFFLKTKGALVVNLCHVWMELGCHRLPFKRKVLHLMVLTLILQIWKH
jgi:hypothetical protein